MIGILILNYKKYQVTADCIRSVLDTGDGLDYHIYVLDNGSGNDSIACLQAQFPNNPRITWMESAENTGYARGNNQMLSRARKDGCTAAVITNSDIVFLPGTLQQLAADIAEGHPIVGPQLQYPNGQRQNSEQIDEFVMTRRLKDLDELVRKMLQTVVDDPNEASRMRKFMSYYLPTTLKLLQSYRTMKTRGVSYSEMNTTRENLIHALDMILQAAQKQLDAMHKDDMLDMSADMDVLEQMLKRDGYMESVLSESLKEANRQQQNASVPYSTQQADLHTSGTAAARQMNQGAPVLKMPEEDIPEADRQQKKFYQN